MPRTGRSRTPLTRERVLRAAVEVADDGGVGALSMRKVAERLGVEAMSLYHHVENKEAILDGVVDAVFADIALPPGDLPWRDAVRHRCVSARAVLLAHPWALGLLDSRATPGPATLRHHDAVLGALRAAGFDVAATASAVSLLDSYVYGFVLQERSLPFSTGEELGDVAEGMLARLPSGTHPHLAEMVAHALRPGYDHTDEFAVGLELVLDAVERLR
ncbi:TetR/AcrR family transcriptional regulator [Thalassiella azotivora]